MRVGRLVVIIVGLLRHVHSRDEGGGGEIHADHEHQQHALLKAQEFGLGAQVSGFDERRT